MSTEAKAAWWVLTIVTLALWGYGFARLAYFNYAIGLPCVILAAAVAIYLRVTFDKVTGVRTS